MLCHVEPKAGACCVSVLNPSFCWLSCCTEGARQVWEYNVPFLVHNSCLGQRLCFGEGTVQNEKHSAEEQSVIYVATLYTRMKNLSCLGRCLAPGDVEAALLGDKQDETISKKKVESWVLFTIKL